MGTIQLCYLAVLRPSGMHGDIWVAPPSSLQSLPVREPVAWGRQRQCCCHCRGYASCWQWRQSAPLPITAPIVIVGDAHGMMWVDGSTAVTEVVVGGVTHGSGAAAECLSVLCHSHRQGHAW